MSAPSRDPGVERQRALYLAGVAGSRPAVPTEPDGLEQRARAVMSARSYAYFAGGAGVEWTLRANRAAFDRWRIVPRVLRDVSTRDTSVELLGQRLPVPILLAPIGVLELAHPEADLAAARAAASLGLPLIFSTQASVPMEPCAAAMGASPRWYQLYWSRVDELMLSFVRRAEACGCRAIVVTLDTTFLGWRPRDLELGHLPFLRGMGIAQYTSDPVFQASLSQPPAMEPPRVRVTPSSLATLVEQAARHPGSLFGNLASGRGRAAVRRFLEVFSRPSLTWSDLDRLRAVTRLPILLKGVLHPDDARRAVDAGMSGVIVSTHGGRQVDGSVASLDALPAVVVAVAGRVPVLLDSGVRTGADVFKALALGAAAVCVGRPWVYGLALAGEEGVRSVLQNLWAEFDLTLALTGCRAVGEVDRAMLRRADEVADGGA